MSNVYIRTAEGGAKTTFNTNDAIPLDDGTDSTYILLTDFAKTGEGDLYNGKISVTVSSNNITVAIKTAAGSDPSTSSPVGVKINGAVRWITAALSVTVNAGANSFNAGAAEFAAKAIQYFPVVSWKSASSVVVLGFGRIPFARVYSDYSGTATNEKYGAFSTAPASTDDCVVIGSFYALLSAAASYNWSVPTFTNSNLRQTPVFKTDLMTWTPTFTNLSVGNGTLTAYYEIIGDQLRYIWTLVWGNTTSISGAVSHTLPFSRYTITDIRAAGISRYNDAGTVYQGASSFISSTAANLQVLNASGTYLTTGALSSTVPFTWTTSDEIMVEMFPYNIK